MLNKKIEVICNRQVEREGYSSNLYLAISAFTMLMVMRKVGYPFTVDHVEHSGMIKLLNSRRI